ncbi:uncharacterized protein DS421_7g220670 [Arachis hypogaea]|nr:uncharacterized protein DS421_7g220670 [Arachis hypogaea]
MKILFYFFVFVFVLCVDFGNNQIKMTEANKITCMGCAAGAEYCSPSNPRNKNDPNAACNSICVFFHGKDFTTGECLPNHGCICTYPNPNRSQPCPDPHC